MGCNIDGANADCDSVFPASDSLLNFAVDVGNVYIYTIVNAANALIEC